MSTSKRTTLLTNVPIETWPGIDMSVLSGEDAESVEKRISALTLYAQGAPHKKITEETGIIRQEINRLLRRCTPLSDDGQVEGFRALFPKKRVASYVRTAPLEREKGSGSAGCAGALGQLFDRFPALKHFIDQEFLRTAPTSKEQDVRIRIGDLHSKFIEWLQGHGVSGSCDRQPYRSSSTSVSPTGAGLTERWEQLSTHLGTKL